MYQEHRPLYSLHLGVFLFQKINSSRAHVYGHILFKESQLIYLACIM